MEGNAFTSQFLVQLCEEERIFCPASNSASNSASNLLSSHLRYYVVSFLLCFFWSRDPSDRREYRDGHQDRHCLSKWYHYHDLERVMVQKMESVFTPRRRLGGIVVQPGYPLALWVTTWKVERVRFLMFFEIFHWLIPSSRTMPLGSMQFLTEISSRYLPWEVKTAGA